MKAYLFITFLASVLLMGTAHANYVENTEEYFRFTERDKSRFGQKTTMSILMNILNAGLKKEVSTPKDPMDFAATQAKS